MPVTADDLAAVLAHSDTVLRSAVHEDWSTPAHRLDWTCWETVEHLADDYFCYGAELSRSAPPSHLRLTGYARRDGGPENVTAVDPEHGPAALLDVLAACGAVLVAMVRTAPPEARGWHPAGYADAEATASMGIVECVAHTWDVATAFGIDYAADPVVVGGVLARIFPDVERTADAQDDLLWATGRVDTAERPRRTHWRWWNEV